MLPIIVFVKLLTVQELTRTELQMFYVSPGIGEPHGTPYT